MLAAAFMGCIGLWHVALCAHKGVLLLDPWGRNLCCMLISVLYLAEQLMLARGGWAPVERVSCGDVYS